MMKRYMYLTESILAYSLAFFSIFPVFLNIENGFITLYQGLWAPRSGFTVPLSVFFIASLAALMLLKLLVRKIQLIQFKSNITVAIIFFIYANVLSLLFGLINYYSFSAILFFIQTVSPVFLWFLGVYLARKPHRVRQMLIIMIVGNAVASWGLLVQSIIERGIRSTLTMPMIDHIGPFYIWGIRDYFPLGVTYISVLGIAFFIQKEIGWKTFFVAVLPGILIIPLIWSKGAVGTFGIAILLLVIIMLSKKRLTWRAVSMVLLLFLLSVMLFLSPQETILVQRLRSDLAGGKVVSLSSRISRWKYALNVIADNPIMGIGFVPERATEFKALGVSSIRIFRSHNQYLDMGVKSGMLGLISFLILVFLVLKRLIKYYAKSNKSFEIGLVTGVLAGWSAILLISNMFQVNFIQPYTGYMLWLTFGLTEGYFRQKQLSLRN